MKHFGTGALALLAAAAATAPAAQAQTEPYIGQITSYAFNFCPEGWAAANGQLLSISGNEPLFALYGTTYGGDGVTTFGLPDLRGRFAIGEGSSTTGTTYIQGEMAGTDQVTLISSNLASHTHVFSGSSARPNTPSLAGATLATYGPQQQVYANQAPPNEAMNPATIGAAGSNLPFPIQQPYLAVTYCVALEGVFPSRP